MVAKKNVCMKAELRESQWESVVSSDFFYSLNIIHSTIASAIALSSSALPIPLTEE